MFHISTNINFARALLHYKRDCNTIYVDIIQYTRDRKNTTTNYVNIIHETEKFATTDYVDITESMYFFFSYALSILSPMA